MCIIRLKDETPSPSCVCRACRVLRRYRLLLFMLLLPTYIILHASTSYQYTRINCYPKAASAWTWRTESPNTTAEGEGPVERRAGAIQQISKLRDFGGVDRFDDGNVQDRSAFADHKWAEPVGEPRESKVYDKGKKAPNRPVIYTESNSVAEKTISFNPVTLHTSPGIGHYNMRNKSISVTVSRAVTQQRAALNKEPLIQLPGEYPVRVDLTASENASERNRSNLIGIYGNIANHIHVQRNEHLKGMTQQTVQAIPSAANPRHVSSNMFLPGKEKGLGANLSGEMLDPYETIPAQRPLNTASPFKAKSLAVRPLETISEIGNINSYLSAAKQKALIAAGRHRNLVQMRDTHEYALKHPTHSDEKAPNSRLDTHPATTEALESERQNKTPQHEHVDLYQGVRNTLEYIREKGKKAGADKKDKGTVTERMPLKRINRVIDEYETQNGVNMLNVVKEDINSKHPQTNHAVEKTRDKEAIQQMLQGVKVPSLEELMDEQVKNRNRHTHVLSSADKERIVQEIRQRVSNTTDSKKLKKVHAQPILTQSPTTHGPQVITGSQANHVHRNVSTPGLDAPSSAAAPTNGSRTTNNNSAPYQIGQIKRVIPALAQSGLQHAAVNHTKVPVLIGDVNALNKTVSQLDTLLKNLSVALPDFLHSFALEKEIESFVKQMYSFVNNLNQTRAHQFAPLSAAGGQKIEEEMDFSLAERLGIQLPSRISARSRKEIDVILKEMREGKRIDRRHYLLLMLHVAPGRDQGNIMAPPPSTCSVTDNMHMMVNSSASEQTDENLSLFHRVDLEDESGRSVEGGPMDYLPNYKNPCWISKIKEEGIKRWYGFTQTLPAFQNMSAVFSERLSRNENWRVRCLPYFYIAGVTKSGTTDLYRRLALHPDVMEPAHKEPMWWNRLTLGIPVNRRKSFRYYLDFFDQAGEEFRRKTTYNRGTPFHPGITVDATPAYLWDYDCWTDIPGNHGRQEPRYLLPHTLRKLTPHARVILILRNPTERLYSQFRMKSHMESTQTFHKWCVDAVTNFKRCLTHRSIRSCTYDFQLSTFEFSFPGGMSLRASLYYVYLNDWLKVFPHHQVMVIKAENYYAHTVAVVKSVFRFLGLSQPTPELMEAIDSSLPVNTRRHDPDRSLEPMLPETKALLDDFFRPFNKRLAKLLKDPRFLWENE